MQVLQGNERAMGTLYDRHAPLVFKLTRTIVGGDADAEEVTADVFVQLWERGDTFDPERGSFRGWLATIARTRALDHVRSRKRRHETQVKASRRDESGTAVEMGTTPAPDQQAHVSRIRDDLDDALENLNPDQRRAIELAYFHGLSQSEIASRLGEPLGTIKTRIRDGMGKLRDLFRAGGGVRA
ncbi:MAG: sigma-70 family RNA polymerase sigma factor [Longimicrobiales bacterium]|nr:sigma-70 family RNA polymerase sigma factor [Longimicrobiales bacterium]